MVYFVRVEKNGDIFDELETNSKEDAVKHFLYLKKHFSKQLKVWIDIYNNPIDTLGVAWLPDSDYCII